MYNDEIKRKFICNHTCNIGGREKYKRLFDSTEQYEIKYGKDLCQMNSEELSEIFSMLCGLRTNSISTRTALINAYLNWCIDNVEFSNKVIPELHIDIVDKMRKMTVVNPMHMQRYLDIVFDKEDEQNISNVYRCYYWLGYSGCREEDAINVKSGDVDLQNMVIRIGDLEYPIYREGIKSFSNCVNLSAFKYLHPNYSKSSFRPRADGDLILRGIKTNFSLSSFRVAVNIKIKEAINSGRTDIKLSYQRAMMSGIFYRIYQLEQIGVEPDFTDIAADFMRGKEYNLSSGRNLIGAKQRKIAKDYLNDYNCWKQTLIR